MASDACKKTKQNNQRPFFSWLERERKDVHKDTTAERVPGLLDDTVDGDFLDVKDGEDGRAEDVHDGLRELVSGACTVGRGEGRSAYARTRVRACVYSPASVAEGKVERIRLRGLAGLGDQAIRVEGHRVLINLRVMHEVPIAQVVSKGRTRAQKKRGAFTRCLP